MDGVEQVCAAGDSGQREATGNALGHGDDVRDNTFVVNSEPFARAAETGLDLVSDEDDALFLGPCGQCRQEAFGRNDEAALAWMGSMMIAATWSPPICFSIMVMARLAASAPVISGFSSRNG